MSQHYQILIVDDEASITTLLKEELEEHQSYQVDLAFDGAEGINLIQKKLYDVVQLLLDEVDSFGSVKGEVNLVGLVFFELFFQEGRDRGFVVHDQDLVMLRHQDAPPSDSERKNLLTQHTLDGSQEVDKIVQLDAETFRALLFRLDGLVKVRQ